MLKSVPRGAFNLSASRYFSRHMDGRLSTITTAEQIRCSHTSQDHIIHSTANHCHSLTQSCPTTRSFSLCLSLATSLTNIRAPHPLTHQILIIKLEELKGIALFPFQMKKQNILINLCQKKTETKSALEKSTVTEGFLAEFSPGHGIKTFILCLCIYTFKSFKGQNPH